MKLRFAHMEKEETVFWKGEYVIDTSQFPELKDITDDEKLMKWLWKNYKKVAVNGDYEDPDAETRGITAYEIVRTPIRHCVTIFLILVPQDMFVPQIDGHHTSFRLF